jgi:hypothetical protein
LAHVEDQTEVNVSWDYRSIVISLNDGPNVDEAIRDLNEQAIRIGNWYRSFSKGDGSLIWCVAILKRPRESVSRQAALRPITISGR